MSIDQVGASRANLPRIVAALFDNATVDAVYAPYGLALLRVAIGIDWIAHAFLKIYRGMHTHEALLAKNGITPLLAWPTFGIEVIGGVAILLGWYTRQWATFLLIFLGVVVWIKWPVGWATPVQEEAGNIRCSGWSPRPRSRLPAAVPSRCKRTCRERNSRASGRRQAMKISSRLGLRKLPRRHSIHIWPVTLAPISPGTDSICHLIRWQGVFWR